MLLLRDKGMPASGRELVERLTSGLREYFHLPGPNPPVLIEGELTGLTRLKIDLSGARMDPGQSVPLPASGTKLEGRISAHLLELDGNPLHVGDSAQLRLHLQGEQAEFVVLSDADQMWWLALNNAQKGTVRAEVGEGQLEQLFLTGVRHALTRYGFTLQEGKVTLRKVDDRSVHLRLEVRARKGFIKGGVEVEGQLSVDRQLNIALTGLKSAGQGVLGKVAVPFLKPLLQRWQAQPLPLLGHAFGELDCHHLLIHLEGDHSLTIEAAFGSDASNP